RHDITRSCGRQSSGAMLRASSARLACTCAKSSGYHQHVVHDHRRQAQDHRPDPDRPENVGGRETSVVEEWMVLGLHVASPCFCSLLAACSEPLFTCNLLRSLSSIFPDLAAAP